MQARDFRWGLIALIVAPVHAYGCLRNRALYLTEPEGLIQVSSWEIEPYPTACEWLIATGEGATSIELNATASFGAGDFLSFNSEMGFFDSDRGTLLLVSNAC